MPPLSTNYGKQSVWSLWRKVTWPASAKQEEYGYSTPAFMRHSPTAIGRGRLVSESALLERYNAWFRTENWDGSRRKMELPANLMQFIVSTLLARITTVTNNYSKMLINQINEMLSSGAAWHTGTPGMSLVGRWANRLVGHGRKERKTSLSPRPTALWSAVGLRWAACCDRLPAVLPYDNQSWIMNQSW